MKAQDEKQELEYRDLLSALEGLGLFPERGNSPDEVKVDAAGRPQEEITQAVNRLRATYGWEQHGRITQNTLRAVRIEVANLQRQLAAQECYQGEPHGRFDDATREALQLFQGEPSHKPLASTGVFDSATREILADLPPYTFDEVLCKELDDINQGREKAGQCPETEAARCDNAVVRAHQARLLGLAFSGGGIRSATFNLGVVQALARLGLLRRVDYLSSVSGGGYIGGWLHAWVSREKRGILEVEQQLAVEAGGAVREPRQVSWLRQFSNYLTPRIGLLSADTMAGAATWLRNVFLNQLILGGLGLLLLCLPWLLLMLPHVLMRILGGQPEKVAMIVSGGGALLLLRAIRKGGLEIAAIEREASLGKSATGVSEGGSRLGGPNVVIKSAAMGALVLGVGAQLALPQFPGGAGSDLEAGRLLLMVLGPSVVLLLLMLFATAAIGLAGRKLREASREWASRVGGILLSLAIGWLALAGVALLGSYGVSYAGAWITAMGGVAWLATTVVGVLLGQSPSTGNGKGGWKNVLAVVAPWVFVAGLFVLLSVALHTAIVTLGGEAGSAVCKPVPDSSIASLRSAYRLSVDMKEGSATGEILQVKSDPGCSLTAYAKASESALSSSSGRFFLLMVAVCLLVFLLNRRVDINVFAFHMFYRNRLERCYLGASNSRRQANPFTNLESGDSPELVDLKQGDSVQRPYPLINTALNISCCKNLAWQERKAASFVFTPAFCGYQLPGTGDADVAAFQKTEQYLSWPVKGAKAGARLGWLALGTPVTISGAAASPNAGYHTNPATALLMTVFNVRLGWWMQNTRELEQWTAPGPKHCIPSLLAELMASTTDASPFVYLSDGGHFENLGIYELVRRRCRYIIACDAGCDGGYSFEDLGNAIRKCQIDLGIEIVIDPRAIAPDPDTGHSRFHCAVGTIHYERHDPVATSGYLLYIKASMTGDEPTDVRQYKAQNREFPHESTGDQWYGESQFESYRKLGEHITMQVLDQAREEATEASRQAKRQGKADRDLPCDHEVLFHTLSEQWFPPSAAGQAAFSMHGAELQKIYDRLRLDANLRFLDSQIYPEWVKLSNRVEQDSGKEKHGRVTMLPPSESEMRAGFYLCNTLIQLMENVYVDLRLDEEHDHPGNRGWMNLFRHWSWAGMFRVTWAICVATYGARFQQFCRRHLGLGSGELILADPVEVGAAGWEDQINFVELEHVRRIIVGHYAALGPGGGANAADPAECPEKTDKARLLAGANGWIANTGSHRLMLQVLELRVSDPFGKEKDFVFPVGFALLARPVAGKPWGLVYYRIQDHLRRMGLGRKGMRKLQESYRDEGILVDMPPTLDGIIAEADPALLQSLWHLVLSSSPQKEIQRL